MIRSSKFSLVSYATSVAVIAVASLTIHADLQPDVVEQKHNLVRSPARPTPNAFVESQFINVGTVAPGQNLVDCVMIRNVGSVPLRAMGGATGCRSPILSMARLSIPPDSSAGIDVRIHWFAEPGDHTITFDVLTDDPRHAAIPITMNYTVANKTGV